MARLLAGLLAPLRRTPSTPPAANLEAFVFLACASGLRLARG